MKKYNNTVGSNADASLLPLVKGARGMSHWICMMTAKPCGWNIPQPPSQGGRRCSFGRLNDKKGWLMLAFSMLFLLSIHAQHPIKLNLKRTIELANDSSLSAFRYQNMYLSGYWEYRTYKANRLPSLTLNLMPAQYYRYITQRYDSNTDTDVYREQQMFSAGGV